MGVNRNIYVRSQNGSWGIPSILEADYLPHTKLMALWLNWKERPATNRKIRSSSLLRASSLRRKKVFLPIGEFPKGSDRFNNGARKLCSSCERKRKAPIA